MTPKTIKSFPRKVKESENLFITLSDGTKLAARMWAPLDAAKSPVPALIEYLPYRKRDGTAVRDEQTHPYLAGHGYACIRVDMRGNGDSDGLMRDEYTQQEQEDCLEVIAWAARQKWCTGKVGMFGLSWGGFNALQVAALRPPALKAIITVCSTDDRYEDDIHYKGGTLLNENAGWAAAMLAYSSRPPDPKIVGAKWKKMWLQRLAAEPFPLIDWLKHPHRDHYWKQGSVCEDWTKINVPVLAVGGWNDAYCNAVPRLMKGLRVPRKAIIGPWTHNYPHLATPGPQIGFLQEMLRWWDEHLKDQRTGIMNEPDYRVFVMNGFKPGTASQDIDGRWIGEGYWGHGSVAVKTWHLTSKGIAATPGEEKSYAICSSQATGLDGGEYCVSEAGPDFAGDQAQDDAQSICFDSPALADDIDIAGQPVLDLSFSVDKPVAHMAVRLNDVWPTGEVSRITYQLQNLCMRDSRETPGMLEPGKRYRMKIKMNETAWRIAKGHKLRVAISTSYFPMMWPAPEPVTLTVYAGASDIQLPVRRKVIDERPIAWKDPELSGPVAVKELARPSHTRTATVDPATGKTRLAIVDDFGTQQFTSHGMVVSSVARENYSIAPDDPLSAVMETHWTQTQKRGSWDIRTETFGKLTASATHWKVWGKIDAYEGKKLVFTKEFNEEIERKLM